MADRIGLRLDVLPRAVLLELAAAGCAAQPQLRSRADAIIQQITPLPSWCTDILLSPDLLPHVFDSLELSDYVAAMVCVEWGVAWDRMLRQRRYVDPKPLKTIQLHSASRGFKVAVMPDETVCYNITQGGGLRFMSPQSGEEVQGGPWQALALAVNNSFGLLQHGDAMFVYIGTRQRVAKLQLSDATELASSPKISSPGEMLLLGDRLVTASGEKIYILDVNTLEVRQEFDGFEQVIDCAVHNGTLYVADMSRPGEILALDLATGTDLDSIEGEFGVPLSLSIHQSHMYVVEKAYDTQDYYESDPGPWDEEELQDWAGRRLIVLEMDGSTRQEVRLPGSTNLGALRFHGDEIFVTDTAAVHKLRLFGHG